MTGVGRAFKSWNLTPRFIDMYHITERVREVAYRIVLTSLSNLHNVFHVSQLHKYVYDSSHVIRVNYLQVRNNLTVETVSLRIEDREVKRLRGKEIKLPL